MTSASGGPEKPQALDPVREHILDATRRCLAAKSFNELTIDDISRASHRPKSAIYRHFPNKDAIVDETLRRTSRQSLQNILGVIGNAGDGKDTLTVAGLIHLMGQVFTSPMLLETGRFNIEWWAWAARSQTGLRGFRETWREWRDAIAGAIRAEVGDDQPEETVQAMAGLIFGLYNGLLLHATLEGEELDIEAIMRLQQDGWQGIVERAKAKQQQEAD